MLPGKVEHGQEYSAVELVDLDVFEVFHQTAEQDAQGGAGFDGLGDALHDGVVVLDVCRGRFVSVCFCYQAHYLMAVQSSCAMVIAQWGGSAAK